MTAKPRIALFIDAENASAKHLPDYLARCRVLGKPTIARCYGGSASLKKWEKAIAEHHLMPMLTPHSANKENASDFALTIDAVSLLHRNLFDHAVIASSDADFTQLAIHIREHGKGVDGIGEAKATKSLQSAFDSFSVFPVHKPPVIKPPEKKSVLPLQEKPVKILSKPAPRPAIDHVLLKNVFMETSKNAASVDLQSLGRALAAVMPDYKKGHRTLDNYLRNSGLFEIRDKKAYLLPLKGH